MPERSEAEEDRRRSPRFSCGGRVKMTPLPSNGIFVPGRILDVSLHGCRIATNTPIDCGLRAEIMVRVNDASFRAVGEVRAIRGRAGAGVEFVHLSAGGKDMLGDLITQLERVQAVMNRLKAARREMDAEFLRKQLEAGELQAALLRIRFPFLKAIESLEPEQAAGKDLTVEAKPLVVPVNLFG